MPLTISTGLTPEQFEETATYLDEEVPNWRNLSATEIKAVLFEKVDDLLDLYNDLSKEPVCSDDTDRAHQRDNLEDPFRDLR